ncbi:5-oxoprolinase subunit PxpA [Lutibacter holmesii]|uniref:5-oxoprolinase subunit PxpA n=1 Tax=Lutibacter holmesii TaxID=1137985 RepID=A0ABW3WQZ3_9FLAO
MIAINCDVGEGVYNEELLMPYIQSCNIACGAHAGSKDIINEVVALAIKNKVKIGAHPSYPDKENFGRKTMLLSEFDLINTIRSQVNLLKQEVELQGGKVHHIKPHGALYNDIAKNKKLANQFLTAISPYKNDIVLYVPYASEIETCALEQGFNIVYEVFADRNYNDDLSLVSRTKKDAVLTSLPAIIKHVLEVINTNKITTISGEKHTIKGATFCVHSDTENAVDIVKGISKFKEDFTKSE